MPAPPQTMRAQLPSLFGWHQIATGWSQRRPVSLHPTITFASWASPHGSPCQHWQRIPSIKRNSTRHETTTTGAAAHLQSLSDEQLAAVTAPPSGSHISVIAGPGSGKTRVLTARVAQLVREHAVPLQDILVITFTNKAADELKARLMRELGQQAELLTAGTFHSIAVRLLHADLPLLPRAGVSRRFKILDQEDALVLLSKVSDVSTYHTERATLTSHRSCASWRSMVRPNPQMGPTWRLARPPLGRLQTPNRGTCGSTATSASSRPASHWRASLASPTVRAQRIQFIVVYHVLWSQKQH